MTRITSLVAALLFIVSALGMTSQDVPEPAESLRQLDPSRPVTYLEVGETLLRSSDQTILAREVLAVGALLAGDVGHPRHDPSLSAGMLIAIAGVAEDPDDHRGLMMLAITLDPDRQSELRWLGQWQVAGARRDSESARVLGLVRMNDPDGARGMNDTVRERIRQEGRAIGFDPDLVGRTLEMWLTDLENDPCRGRLFVRERSGDSLVMSQCPSPHLHHGVRRDDAWTMMVAIELSLSNQVPNSWAVRGSLGLDRPLVSWDLDTLAQRYSVSARRPVYRSGRWVGADAYDE